MRTYRFPISVIGLIVIGLLLLHLTTRPAKANTVCTESAIAGTYGFAVDGLGTSSRNVPHIGGFVPVAAAGTFNFDGVGTVSRTFTFSFAGIITPGVSQSGAYTVSSSPSGCTGVATFPDANETLNLVIVSGGNEIAFINATPGIVLAGSMKK